MLLAIAASGPGAAKPTKLDDFLGTHPIAKTFLSTQKWPKSYAAISYYGVNAFQFTNAKGVSHFIRYQFIPEQGEELISPEQGTGMTANYLQDEIKTRIVAHANNIPAGIATADPMLDFRSRAYPISVRGRQ